MNYQIKNIPFLRKVLWADFAVGFSVGSIGLGFMNPMASILGLSLNFILWVSIISALYSMLAMRLALMPNISTFLLRVLIYANAVWTAISVGLLYFHFEGATLLGQLFLIVQILVAGALAYIENQQLTKKNAQ